MHQACQDPVTHRQICLEAPVKLTAAVTSSRLFSHNLLVTHCFPTIRTPGVRIASKTRTQARLARIPSTPVLPFWTSWGISLDRLFLLSHVAAAGSTVYFEFHPVSANRLFGNLPCSFGTCSHSLLSCSFSILGQSHLEVPVPPPATTAPESPPVQGRSPTRIKVPAAWPLSPSVTPRQFSVSIYPTVNPFARLKALRHLPLLFCHCGFHITWICNTPGSTMPP